MDLPHASKPSTALMVLPEQVAEPENQLVDEFTGLSDNFLSGLYEVVSALHHLKEDTVAIYPSPDQDSPIHVAKSSPIVGLFASKRAEMLEQRFMEMYKEDSKQALEVLSQVFPDSNNVVHKNLGSFVDPETGKVRYNSQDSIHLKLPGSFSDKFWGGVVKLGGFTELVAVNALAGMANAVMILGDSFAGVSTHPNSLFPAYRRSVIWSDFHAVGGFADLKTVFEAKEKAAFTLWEMHLDDPANPGGKLQLVNQKRQEALILLLKLEESAFNGMAKPYALGHEPNLVALHTAHVDMQKELKSSKEQNRHDIYKMKMDEIREQVSKFLTNKADLEWFERLWEHYTKDAIFNRTVHHFQMGTPLKEAFSHRISSMFANQILDGGGRLET